MRPKRAEMNSKFRKILVVEIVVAFIVIIFLLAGRQSTQTVTPSPTPSPTITQQSNLVEGCDSVVSAKTSNEQWDAAPALNLEDERNYWTLKTNCGDIVIELYAIEAPISVNSLRFLTDEGYYDGTPCHRLTTASFFVIQCGDPLGTGFGNPGYTIMEENRPESGTANYPVGTVAIAKGNQPNSSGAQFFIVHKDTTLAPSYSIVGKVIVGMDIVEAIAEKGTLGGVADGKPLQNFGIIEALLSKKNPAPEETAAPEESPAE